MNRDGAVDVTGDLDVAGKAAWNSGRGAIFLPNLTPLALSIRTAISTPVIRSVGPGGGLSLRPQLTRDHDLVPRTVDGRGGAAEA
ncbi:hypothetical protein IM697_19950 [Streptomyces ferrugineus]|uniref:Uncharacterized protein n=1 Tax=Streptomyces ferrugineus TaxID=1413221 RepID=A0A7M2SW22_9ACTN|nr:hypothetical protein [Streptomyces ferrugineus]QOV40472.1 hypothetical protein IM697_19950 [Streptomyces ferrugineus]